MFGIFYIMIVASIVIIFRRFFFFSPTLGVIAPLPAFVNSYCFPPTVDDFIIIFITFPPIAIHETTHDKMPFYGGRIWVHKATQLASSTRTSYLRLVLLNHLGLREGKEPEPTDVLEGKELGDPSVPAQGCTSVTLHARITDGSPNSLPSRTSVGSGSYQ